MKVLYLTNIPSPYRVAYFNELGKKCDLTVVFEKSSSTERDDSWKIYNFKTFKGIVLNGISIRTDAAVCPGVITYLKRDRFEHIVVTNMSSPTGLLAIAWLKRLKIPYSIEGDGAFAGDGKGFKEKLKKWVISSAKECFSTSKEHDKYYLTYGADANRIYRYPFTSVYDRYILQTPIDKTSKESIKREIGIREKQMILSVGAFIPRKGLDLLIKAMSDLPKDWGVYLVGGEPTEDYLKLKNELTLDNLHFVGFKKTDELKLFYAAADLFVLPTREDIWGLVINEALAYALPVVTTNRCIAGMELVRNGFNGCIVEHNCVEALQEGIKTLIESEEYREQCSRNALKIIREYTIEKMVEAHMHVWSNTEEH